MDIEKAEPQITITPAIDDGAAIYFCDDDKRGYLGFSIKGNTILLLYDDGAIMVRGREVDNDKVFVKEFKEWFNKALACIQ